MLRIINHSSQDITFYQTALKQGCVQDGGTEVFKVLDWKQARAHS